MDWHLEVIETYGRWISSSVANVHNPQLVPETGTCESSPMREIRVSVRLQEQSYLCSVRGKTSMRARDVLSI
jgi:hypothetical protein